MPIIKRLAAIRARRSNSRHLTASSSLESITTAFGIDWLNAWPPEFLLEAVGDRGKTDAASLIAPHWDGVVDMIGVDGRGYATAVQLLDRLTRLAEDHGRQYIRSSMMGAVWNRDATALQHCRLVQEAVLRDGYGLGDFRPTALDAMLEEGVDRVAYGDGFGPDQTLKMSLGWPTVRSDVNSRTKTRAWESVHADYQGPDRYTLTPLRVDGHPKYQERAEHLCLIPSSTWAEALRRISDSRAQIETAMRTREHEFLAFRRDVVADVLSQFEIAGSVAHFDSTLWETFPDLSPDDDLIARKAYEVIVEDGARFGSKSSVVDAVVTDLRESGHSYGKARVITALKNARAYRVVGGQGEAGPETRDFELKRLVRQLTLRYGKKSL